MHDLRTPPSARIRVGLALAGLPWALRPCLGFPSEPIPEVEVSSVRRVFHNGEHNAFTDLCRFKGQLYLTFRSCPDRHMVHPSASIIILESHDNGANWVQVHRFSVKERDTRDPHFLVLRDRLFVYTGTWYSGPGTLAREDYYSSHERDASGKVLTAIYLAELNLKRNGRP